MRQSWKTAVGVMSNWPNVDGEVKSVAAKKKAAKKKPAKKAKAKSKKKK